MKILQIIQRPQLRGAEIFACQLAEQLVSLGQEVDVLILFGDKSIGLPFELPFYYLTGNEKKRWWDFSGYKRLSNIIRQNKYDLVQANAGDTLKYASLSRFLFGWKSKLVFRNANKISDFINSPAKLKINEWLIRQVDFVASVSNECKADFENTFHFDKNLVQSLPIGVNTQQQLLRVPLQEMGIDQSQPVLLSVAGFVKEKNHAGIMRIFQAVKEQFPGAQLLLVGQGKLKNNIQDLCNEMGLAPSVVFLGRRNDVSAIMLHSSVLVLPSLIEGLPAVILEAFSNKLPVVAYNVGGISEVVMPGKTGWLIEKNDEDKFADAVKRVLAKPGELEQLTNNAFQLAKEQYDNKVIAKRFLHAYQQVVGEKKMIKSEQSAA